MSPKRNTMSAPNKTNQNKNTLSNSQANHTLKINKYYFNNSNQMNQKANKNPSIQLLQIDH